MGDRNACSLEAVHIVPEHLVLCLNDVFQVPDGPWALVAALEVGDERVGEMLPGLDGAWAEVVEPCIKMATGRVSSGRLLPNPNPNPNPRTRPRPAREETHGF